MTTPAEPVHVEDLAWLRVEHASAVGTVRRAVTGLAERLGMPSSRTHEIELVVSEIADNQLKHAGGGWVLVRACRSARGPGLCVVALDTGPGIADFSAAARDGHSTAGSLGIGLGAVLRLSDTWDVHTDTGTGTVLMVGFGCCDPTEPGPRVATAAGLTRPMSGQEVCGDSYAVRHDSGTVTGLVADGLGHGPLAALASQTAVRAFLAAAPGSPGDLLSRVHRSLQSTRGAAAAIAQVRASGVELCFAGIGNIGGHLLGPGTRRGLTSFPGIVGGNARAPREFSYPLDPDSVVLLHSDGVSEKLVVAPSTGLLRRTPLVIAATIMRDHAVRNDDAGILVLRPEPDP